MDVFSEADFLVCLDNFRSLSELEVFGLSKQHFLAATKEAGFTAFRGHDYEIIHRLRGVFHAQDSESSLWGQVFIDLWYCNNFGGRYWEELVVRDPANIRYAIQAAYWVFAESSADGGRRLATLINRGHCGRQAAEYMRQQAIDGMQGWWQHSVLPYTLR